jgi:hypothetical protein
MRRTQEQGSDQRQWRKECCVCGCWTMVWRGEVRIRAVSATWVLGCEFGCYTMRLVGDFRTARKMHECNIRWAEEKYA